MIRLLSTLAGAMRAHRSAGERGPILRLLDDPHHAFVVGLGGSSTIYVLDPATGKADGSIDVLDLMAGAGRPADMRQGVTPAGHAVLDDADYIRQRLKSDDDASDVLSRSAEEFRHARSGPLDARRAAIVKMAGFLIVAAELIDEELSR